MKNLIAKLRWRFFAPSRLLDLTWPLQVSTIGDEFIFDDGWWVGSERTVKRTWWRNVSSNFKFAYPYNKVISISETDIAPQFKIAAKRIISILEGNDIEYRFIIDGRTEVLFTESDDWEMVMALVYPNEYESIRRTYLKNKETRDRIF